MDSEVLKVRLPFQVQYGAYLSDHVDFATFEEALTFYVGYTRCQQQFTLTDRRRIGDDGPSLVNIDNIDGAEDASAAAQHGLTAEEWERVQEVG